MALRVKCRCGKALNISAKFAGKKLACPNCKHPFRIPAERFAAAGQLDRDLASNGAAVHSSRVAPPTHPRKHGTAKAPLPPPIPSSGTSDLDAVELLTDLAGFEAQAEATATKPSVSIGHPRGEDDLFKLDDAPFSPPASGEQAALEGGVICPSCRRGLPAGTKICVACGINVKTGRSLITAEESHLDKAEDTARKSLTILAWLSPIGFCPIASEGFGKWKPWTVRAIAIVTIVISLWFGVYERIDSPKMMSMKNLMLWSGDKDPSALRVYLGYAESNLGDRVAFMAKLDELRAAAKSPNDQTKAEKPDAAADKHLKKIEAEEDGDQNSEEPQDADAESSDETALPMYGLPHDQASEEYDEDAEDEDFSQESASDSKTKAPKNGMDEEVDLSNPIIQQIVNQIYGLTRDDYDRILVAHHSLAPQQQCLGTYHSYQLLTNAFLHGGILHLVGNLVFLMVLGGRVNALIGNVYSSILYPIFAIIASVAHMLSMSHGVIGAAVGASGAIMGMAGMYLVLFPVNKIHMAAWIRWGLMSGFRVSMGTFALRGFWVVLFYIALDILHTVLQSKDGVAHWAHLGGFIAGVVFAIILLTTRLLNARGGDIFSVILGKRAWAIVGKPRA